MKAILKIKRKNDKRYETVASIEIKSENEIELGYIFNVAGLPIAIMHDEVPCEKYGDLYDKANYSVRFLDRTKFDCKIEVEK